MVWKINIGRRKRSTSTTSLESRETMGSLESANSSTSSLGRLRRGPPAKGCLRKAPVSTIDGQNSATHSASIDSSSSTTHCSQRSEVLNLRGSEQSQSLPEGGRAAGSTSSSVLSEHSPHSTHSSSLGSSYSSTRDRHGHPVRTPLTHRKSEELNGTTRSSSSSILSSQSSSQRSSQKVKFSVVEIRLYERQVSDNPSCSDGCPIGIGWNHVDVKAIRVNQYEHSKPYRKDQMEMILTKDERADLLTDWGVDHTEMVSAIRSLLKAKNQRRQTVRNLNKASVEEGFESATKKLKKLLLHKKGTNEQVKELQKQADLASVTLSPQFVVDSPISSKEIHQDECVDEHDRHLCTNSEQQQANRQDLEEAKGLSECKEASRKTMEASARSDMPAGTIFEDREMDAVSCISGFTLGNRTTASENAIEKFHQELEVELFGDQELPSMVGQTLEVDIDIPEEEKVYYDASPICGTEEPPSVVSELVGDESVVRRSTHVFHNGQYSNGGMEMQRLQNPTNTFSPSMDVSYNIYDSSVYGHYQMQTNYGQPEISPFRFRLGGSLTSAATPETTPRLASRIPYCTAAHSTLRSVSTASTQQSMEYPQVSHTPCLSHLTPSNWMDGTTSTSMSTSSMPRSMTSGIEGSNSTYRQTHSWDAVVISEEDGDLDELFVEQRGHHQSRVHNYHVDMGITEMKYDD